MSLYFNGTAVTSIYYNGTPLNSLWFNGVEVFAVYTESTTLTFSSAMTSDGSIVMRDLLTVKQAGTYTITLANLDLGTSVTTGAAALSAGDIIRLMMYWKKDEKSGEYVCCVRLRKNYTNLFDLYDPTKECIGTGGADKAGTIVCTIAEA